MSDIRENIKSYFALDKEIKESTKLIGELRKKRKATGDDILTWMKANSKTRIKTNHGIIERTVQARKVPVNAAYIQECAASFLNNEEQASILTKLVYEQRPSQESEVLKTLKPDQNAPPPEETADL